MTCQWLLVFCQAEAVGRYKALFGAKYKRPDTVGQPPSTDIDVPNLPSLKAKKLEKRPREKYS
jgi:hypothetical protein